MCIIMFVTTLMLFVTLEAAFAGYAGSSSNNVDGGYGYGYSGSFSGTGGDIPAPPIPNFENFGALFTGYFDSLQKYHEQFLKNRPYSYSVTFSSPSSSSSAQSSITFLPNNRLQQQAQQTAGQTIGNAPGFVPFGGGGGGGVNGGGAVASASVGLRGGYHTAAVYPENPNSPNIFSRFAETSQGGGTGGPGSYGVFTSSVSSSSNLDGKVHNFHRASTTINDNGKISTYTVKNP